ncbi:MAG: thermonuclease family protein [Nitrospirales bacterium]|nr:thermonuclease family protein [Nitrospira sp.]MDR4502719.1 thermonuclease family protein [Nitrospirales bacterium]
MFQVGDKPITVHLANIHAPEMQAHCDREHHLARSALAFVSDALARAERIELDIQGTDRHQDSLAIVYADGKSVNQLLVDYEFAVSSTENHDPLVWCPQGMSP